MNNNNEYSELKKYQSDLEEEIVSDLKKKIRVVEEMLKDEKQHSDLAIILNTETVLSDTVRNMATAFSLENVSNIHDAKRIYNDEKYYFIRVGYEMGSDSGMRDKFEELEEVSQELNDWEF